MSTFKMCYMYIVVNIYQIKNLILLIFIKSYTAYQTLNEQRSKSQMCRYNKDSG